MKRLQNEYIKEKRCSKMKFKKIIVLLLMVVSLFGCQSKIEQVTIDLNNVPEYSNEAYVVLNNNVPNFNEEDKTTQSFEQYSELDSLERCGTAYANLSMELMPKEKRGSIGQVKPSGWHSTRYEHVEGKNLYNRCHLIGFQLAGENANEKNLITGTRYMNTEGMLPFENMVADYIKETNNHVLYRVTPIFKDDELIARGVVMEAESIEDNGEGIQFNVYVYNVQPGVTIDYATGESSLDQEESLPKTEVEIRGNKRSKIYHCPGQNAYEDMADSNNLVVFSSEQEAIEAGYRKAKQ